MLSLCRRSAQLVPRTGQAQRCRTTWWETRQALDALIDRKDKASFTFAPMPVRPPSSNKRVLQKAKRAERRNQDRMRAEDLRDAVLEVSLQREKQREQKWRDWESDYENRLNQRMLDCKAAWLELMASAPAATVADAAPATK
eukprot:TRINITY_DN18983_c0_g1_i1.p1 TRINITY_DN18983_c0_g1~~TRINITY_DN18983_c0_g1_i1.p1  ORF type:complete len:142 (+),score=25.79 TRINITY_DN18983_c0_g1_i1:26-451(+)